MGKLNRANPQDLKNVYLALQSIFLPSFFLLFSRSTLLLFPLESCLILQDPRVVHYPRLLSKAPGPEQQQMRYQHQVS